MAILLSISSTIITYILQYVATITLPDCQSCYALFKLATNNDISSLDGADLQTIQDAMKNLTNKVNLDSSFQRNLPDQIYYCFCYQNTDVALTDYCLDAKQRLLKSQ